LADTHLLSERPAVHQIRGQMQASFALHDEQQRQSKGLKLLSHIPATLCQGTIITVSVPRDFTSKFSHTLARFWPDSFQIQPRFRTGSPPRAFCPRSRRPSHCEQLKAYGDQLYDNQSIVSINIPMFNRKITGGHLGAYQGLAGRLISQVRG
jgi:hypothetical protein